MTVEPTGPSAPATRPAPADRRRRRRGRDHRRRSKPSTATATTGWHRSAKRGPIAGCVATRSTSSVARSSGPPRSRRPATRRDAAAHDQDDTPVVVNRFGAGRPRPRLISTLIVLLLVLGVVLAKVGLMQGMGGETLRAQAAELWTRSRQLPAQRGTIFDRNGDELALVSARIDDRRQPAAGARCARHDRDPRRSPRAS